MLVAAAVGLSVQPPLAWLASRQGINVLLAVLVFATAVTIEPAALGRLTQTWRPLAAALAAGIVVLPALSWAVSRVVAAGSLRDGVMVAGLAPCEIASVATTAMAAGEAAVAAGVLIGSTVATVAVAGPILTLEAGHASVHPGHIIANLALVVAVPLAAGLVVRAGTPLGERVERPANVTAVVTVAALVALIAAEVHLSARYVAVTAALVMFLAVSALVGWVLGAGTRRPVGVALLLTASIARFRHCRQPRHRRVRPGRVGTTWRVRDLGAHMGHRRCWCVASTTPGPPGRARRMNCLPERGDLGFDGAAEAGEALAVEGVPDPFAPPVAVDQTGLGEDLEVVGDGRLGSCRAAPRSRTRRSRRRGRRPACDSTRSRTGSAEGGEPGGQLGGLVGVEGGGEH